MFADSSDNLLTGNVANENRSFGIPVFSAANGNQVIGNTANRNLSCGLAAMWDATGNVLQAVPAHA